MAGLAEKEVNGEEKSWKGGDQGLGAFSLPYPLPSFLKVLFLYGLRAMYQRMALPIPTLPPSAAGSCRPCLFKSSHRAPAPRHYLVHVVTMKLLGHCRRPLMVCSLPELSFSFNPFSTSQRDLPKGQTWSSDSPA